MRSALQISDLEELAPLTSFRLATTMGCTAKCYGIKMYYDLEIGIKILELRFRNQDFGPRFWNHDFGIKIAG